MDDAVQTAFGGGGHCLRQLLEFFFLRRHHVKHDSIRLRAAGRHNLVIHGFQLLLAARQQHHGGTGRRTGFGHFRTQSLRCACNEQDFFF